MKWNKTLVVEYSTAMRSKLEEIMQEQNPMSPDEQQRYQMLLQALQGGQTQEGV